MIKVGVHVSIAGFMHKSVERALERKCDCFQIFTKNPRGWQAKPILDDEASLFQNSVKRSGIDPIYAHMPYLPNLASDKKEIYQRSIDALIQELKRCNHLKIPYLVTHLGHASDDTDKGRGRVISGINQALSVDPGTTMLLLENTAGERNSVGSSLEHISVVYRAIEDDTRVGVCFDTCHAFAAGYNLRDERSIELVMDQFSGLIGYQNLHLVHLNDAKGDIGSGLDRHDHIGLGSIGEEGIRGILHHPVLKKIPFICETPVDERRGDEDNISEIRRLAL